MVVSKKKVLPVGFFTIFAIGLFVPSFTGAGTSGAILVNGMIIFVSLIFVSINWKFVFSSLNNPIIQFFMLAQVFFMALIPVSMYVGVLFGVTPIWRDAFEFHRPVLYSLVLLVSYAYFYHFPRSYIVFQRALIVIFVSLCFFAYLQYNRLWPDFLLLYTGWKNIIGGRVSAPFVNPYDMGFFMSFFVFYFFIGIIYARSIIFGRLIHLFLFLSAVLVVVATQSRSVAMGLLISFGIVLPLFFFPNFVKFDFRKLRIHRSFLIFLGLFSLLVIGLSVSIPHIRVNFNYLYSFFERFLGEGAIDRSGKIRIDQLAFALERAGNPLILLFGNGPAKDLMEFVESIYTYYFFRYGLLGLFIYFSQLSVGVVLAFKLLKRAGPRDRNFVFYVAIFIWLVSIPLQSIGNNFTEQIRLSLFYYTILGSIISGYNLRRVR